MRVLLLIRDILYHSINHDANEISYAKELMVLESFYTKKLLIVDKGFGIDGLRDGYVEGVNFFTSYRVGTC